MAITSLTTRRVNIPHEQGEWVEIRMPSLRHAQEFSKFGEDQTAATMFMLKSCVIAWSYDAPVTEENILDLDIATAKFLADVLSETGTEADTKNS